MTLLGFSKHFLKIKGGTSSCPLPLPAGKLNSISNQSQLPIRDRAAAGRACALKLDLPGLGAQLCHFLIE